MAREADAALQLKILRIGFVLVFTVAVLYAIRSLMFGARSTAGLIAFAFLGLATALILDENYWLTCPFFATSGLSLPGLPFSGIELGCVFLIAIYFLRLTIRRGNPLRLDRDLLILSPVLLWVFVVWMLNPVGLAMFGSNTIGGRFYFDMAIGAFSLLVLSTIRISEKGARYLFYAILLAQSCSLVKGILFPTVDPDIVTFAGAEPEQSTRYAFIVCSSMFILLFARHSLSSILSSPFKVLFFALLALLTLYSGKRRAFGAIALVPFFRVFLTGKERFLTFSMAVVAALFLVFAVIGDGKAYNLPRSAKRVLAVAFPKYKQSAATGGIQDFFREQMREQARWVIRKSPWFGRKGFAMNLNETAWIHYGGGGTNQFASHAYAGNWHSTWYAYAADFGLPCMVLYAIFFLYMLRYSYIGCREVTEGTFRPACCLYYAMSLFVSAAFSYTSGHSARTLLGHCLIYGMLLAIVRGYRQNRVLGAA